MLFFGLLIFVLLFGGGFYAATLILRFLIRYLSITYDLALVALSPADVLMAIIQIDLLLITIVCAPLLLIAFIWYLKPALYENERRWIAYVPAMYLLAMLGVLSGWKLATNIFIPYFQNFSRIIGIQNVWSLDKVISFVLTSIFAGVVLLQIPILVVGLVNLNVLKLEKLKEIRKAVVLAAVVAAAVITPTPDALTQLIIALPIYLLFELSIQWCQLKKMMKKIR